MYILLKSVQLTCNKIYKDTSIKLINNLKKHEHDK